MAVSLTKFEGMVFTLAFLAIFPTSVEANPLRFHCVYPTYSDNEAGPKQAKGFSLEFALDTVSDKAVMIGNNGVEEVLAHKGADGLTFLEFLPTGAVQSTTISSTGESVHSRHSVMGGKIVPSQYYGKCS